MGDAIGKHLQPSLKDLSELEKLTRAYGKFSGGAVGLGHVLGGGLVFLSASLLYHHVHLGVFGRVLLGAGPFVWILGKEWLQENYYQFSGRVRQPRRVWENVLLALLTGITGLFSLTASGFVIHGLLQDFSWRLALSSLVYVALLLAMPFVVWRYLRAPYEFVVGVFLFTLSAILLSGTSLPPAHGRAAIIYLLAASAQVVALVMVPVGLVEHMEFLKLRRRVHALKEAA
ncbi:MAG: hypothetical protein P4N24_04520 [Acidobacteriota bacterium]|nr:hypothetical protein [Acidobacteriota bacterium]